MYNLYRQQQYKNVGREKYDFQQRIASDNATERIISCQRISGGKHGWKNRKQKHCFVSFDVGKIRVKCQKHSSVFRRRFEMFLSQSETRLNTAEKRKDGMSAAEIFH